MKHLHHSRNPEKNRSTISGVFFAYFNFSAIDSSRALFLALPIYIIAWVSILTESVTYKKSEVAENFQNKTQSCCLFRLRAFWTP